MRAWAFWEDLVWSLLQGQAACSCLEHCEVWEAGRLCCLENHVFLQLILKQGNRLGTCTIGSRTFWLISNENSGFCDLVTTLGKQGSVECRNLIFNMFLIWWMTLLCVSFLNLTYFVPCQSSSLSSSGQNRIITVSMLATLKLREVRWVEHKIGSQEFQMAFLIAALTLAKPLISDYDF